ncbi:MAG TPA: hypothetical protein VMC05_07590, partial [Xanthobacteraceae bacterium]|nr:hypothetical protein [Xanthobacteraceae bacterium]
GDRRMLNRKQTVAIALLAATVSLPPITNGIAQFRSAAVFTSGKIVSSEGFFASARRGSDRWFCGIMAQAPHEFLIGLF